MSSFKEFKSAEPNPNFDGVSDISVDEVMENKNDLVLVDVRTQEEYHGELGHITNAKLLTLDSLPEQVESLPRDKSIVFICRSGQRSAKAALIAQSVGIQECYNMKGGMILWNQKGYPVEQ